VAEEGREYSEGIQVALVDWLLLATAKALAIPLGVSVMLVAPPGGALHIWDMDGDTPPTLRQIACARWRQAGPAASLPEADQGYLACILVVDMSDRRAATAQIAPAPPQLAVVTLGQLAESTRHEEKQSATLTLTGDDRRLPWARALDLFDHLIAQLEDPLELLT